MEQPTYASADDLIPAADSETPREDLKLSRGMVCVRGLTRGEVFIMQKAKESGRLKGAELWERRLIATALVAPEMTEAQVAVWQQRDIAGGDVEELTKAITRLSGLNEGADKSRGADVRDDGE